MCRPAVRRRRAAKAGTRPASLTDAAWQADLELLEQTHRSLCGAVAALAPNQLDDAPPRSTVSNLQIVAGIAAHDIYHAGQMQLLKRLAADNGIN